MNKLFLSKEEARNELISLGAKYLDKKDMEEVLSIFEKNISGRQIMYILSKRKLIDFEESDKDRVKMLASSMGV